MHMHIINLTQHNPTPEQREAGVGDVIPDAIPLLNFEGVYDYDLVIERAAALVEIAKREAALAPANEYWQQVMVGGLPALMAPLQQKLLEAGFAVSYAISDRVSVETPQPDGTVKKTLVFKHLGFCTVYPPRPDDSEDAWS